MRAFSAFALLLSCSCSSTPEDSTASAAASAAAAAPSTAAATVAASAVSGGLESASQDELKDLFDAQMVVSLKGAQAKIDRLRAQTGPKRDAQLAKALAELAGFAMGDGLTQADSALREAVALRRAAVTRDPKDVAACMALTQAILRSGDLARIERRQAVTQTTYDEALTVAQRCVGLAPSDPAAQDLRVVSVSKLAEFAVSNSDRSAGYALYQRAQTLDVNHVRVDSEVFAALADRGVILSRLAGELGHAKAAQAHAESAVGYAKKAMTDPTDPGALAVLADTRVALGDTLRSAKAYAAATAAYTQAADDRRQLSQLEPGDVIVGFGRVEITARLAAVALDQKQGGAAESQINRGQALADQLPDGGAFDAELKQRARLALRTQRLRLFVLRGDTAAVASEAAAIRALLPKVSTGGVKGKAIYQLNRLNGPP